MSTLLDGAKIFADIEELSSDSGYVKIIGYRRPIVVGDTTKNEIEIYDSTFTDISANVSSDIIHVVESVEVTIHGENGNDIIYAVSGDNNILEGNTGNDIIVVKDSQAQLIKGGSGNDIIIIKDLKTKGKYIVDQTDSSLTDRDILQVTQYVSADFLVGRNEAQDIVLLNKNLKATITINNENEETIRKIRFSDEVLSYDKFTKDLHKLIVVVNENVNDTINGNDFTKTEDAENIIVVTDSVLNGKVYGGYGGSVYENEVVINTSNVNDRIYGAYTDNFYALQNIITLEGCFVEGSMYGAMTENGALKNNVVNVLSCIVNNVRHSEEGVRNYIQGGNSYSGDVEFNTVNITDSVIDNEVFIVGAFSMQGKAAYNTVNINNSTLNGIPGDDRAHVYGAETWTKQVEYNTVNINNSVLDVAVYGAYSQSGSVCNNNVNIINSEINNNIYGVYINDNGLNRVPKESIGNKVDITGGTIKGNIYASFIRSNTIPVCYSNSVVIGGEAVVEGSLYASTFLNNTNNNNLVGDTIIIKQGVNISGKVCGYVKDDTIYCMAKSNKYEGNSGNDTYIIDWNNADAICLTEVNNSTDKDTIKIFNADIHDIIFSRTSDSLVIKQGEKSMTIEKFNNNAKLEFFDDYNKKVINMSVITLGEKNVADFFPRGNNPIVQSPIPTADYTVEDRKIMSVVAENV